ELPASIGDRKNSALCDHGDLMVGRQRALRIERYLLHLIDKAFDPPFVYHLQATVPNRQVKTTRGERPAKDEAAHAMNNVYESPASGHHGTETAHIHIAFGIHFAKGQNADIRTAAFIHVEDIKLIQDRLGIA